jgi:hypothetical protein
MQLENLESALADLGTPDQFVQLAQTLDDIFGQLLAAQPPADVAEPAAVIQDYFHRLAAAIAVFDQDALNELMAQPERDQMSAALDDFANATQAECPELASESPSPTEVGPTEEPTTVGPTEGPTTVGPTEEPTKLPFRAILGSV